jgi:hypothetical protein
MRKPVVKGYAHRNGSFMLLVRRSIVLLFLFLFVVFCERGCSVPAPWELGMVMFAQRLVAPAT